MGHQHQGPQVGRQGRLNRGKEKGGTVYTEKVACNIDRDTPMAAAVAGREKGGSGREKNSVTTKREKRSVRESESEGESLLDRGMTNQMWGERVIEEPYAFI